MQEINFEKLDNKWYVIMDDYEGDHEDLEMVDGADIFLNYISNDDRLASIKIYDEDPTIDNYSILQLIHHDDFGATYQVLNCDDYNKTIWLCNVAHLFFNGEHPEVIYFNVLQTY